MGATAATGSTFNGWSGTGCTTGTVTMDTNKNCTANFGLITGALTLPASCTILVNAATCVVSASWSTTNTTGAYLWDRNVSQTKYTANNSNTLPNTDVWVAYGGTTFDLKNGNGTILDSKTVSASCNIGSTWNGTICAVNKYPITATTGSGGNVTPAGTTLVDYMTSQSYTISENPGYAISTVTVDGVNKGSISSYTFSNVIASHNISATFDILGCMDPASNDYNPQATASNGACCYGWNYWGGSSCVQNTTEIHSLAAIPRTGQGVINVTTSWDIKFPTNTCTMTATAVCKDGLRSNCTATQLAEETSLNQSFLNETTDSNDVYGASRSITTALRTAAPNNNPTGTKALGKKTVKITNTTDLNLNCNSGVPKSIRVLITTNNEG